jgi:protease I
MRYQILLIIAQENFQEREFFETKEVFEKSAAKITVASNSKNIATGSSGSSIKPDLSFNQINVGDYDAFILIGGFGAKEYLWDDLKLGHLLKEASKKGKVVGAICLAPVILARAGLLSGQEATVHKNKTTISEYNQHGVHYIPEEVVVLKKIVTGRGPSASKKFGVEILKLLNSLKTERYKKHIQRTA